MERTTLRYKIPYIHNISTSSLFISNVTLHNNTPWSTKNNGFNNSTQRRNKHTYGILSTTTYNNNPLHENLK
jgi:hypothetical protein